MKQNLLSLIFLFFIIKIHSQSTSYPINLIPENLKANVNSVVREQKMDVKISSASRMSIKTYKAITVFNKHGLSNIDAIEGYDKSTTIKTIEAVVYNQFGFEIKKIKRKDFVDQSVAGDAGDITDNRILILDYTPTEYPFTIVYQSEAETSNTAFIPKWYPQDDYEESVQKSEYHITYPSDLGFKYREMYFDNSTPLKKKVLENRLEFLVENVEAKKIEDLASFEFPYIIFGSEKFYLEGVEGNAKNWKDFGLWVNNELLTGTNELSDETKQKITGLTSQVTDPIEKAKIIYQYVQDRTRYVSIQLGIGGWKPMLAKNVDRLGYGDCKALTNYTKSLLEAVGVTSYYTIIYGGNKHDILEDFVSMQGNHVILAIPQKGQNYIFLECTSQKDAFGFQGSFTDDRLALVIKPEGGEIVKTNTYYNQDNSQFTKGVVNFDENGNLKTSIDIQYRGIQYASAVNEVYLAPQDFKDKLKERYSNLVGLVIENFKLSNDKKNISLTETLKLQASDYIKKVGEEYIFAVNIFNQNSYTPKRYRSRKYGFEVSKGFYDEDVIEIDLPANKKIVFTPEKVKLESKFGQYELEVIVITANKVKYTRKLSINKGEYGIEDYDLYRQFREQIAKLDNSKIILK